MDEGMSINEGSGGRYEIYFSKNISTSMVQKKETALVVYHRGKATALSERLISSSQ